MNWVAVFFTSKYAVQVFIASLIFLSPYKRKKYYFLRLIIPVALIAAGAVLTSFLPYNDNQIYNFLRFFAINFLLYFGMLFCYNTSFSNVLFSSTAAMALQQFTAGLLSLVRLGGTFRSVVGNYVIATILDELIAYTPIYTGFYFLFVYKIKNKGYHNADNLKMKIMSAVIVFVCIGIYRFTDSSTTNGIIVGSLYSMVCCVFALVIQFALHEQITLRNDLRTERELRRQETKHYENWRDSVEIINVKYHDLKHQISMIKQNKDDGNWQEIEKALTVYDDMLKTGNKVLDVILSEKKMLGDKFNISIMCMADGEALKFMKESDIYSLFGNALDNAMNAVKKIKDEKKRTINLIVRRAGEPVVIHIENYFEGEISFRNGLPQTTGDIDFHGFGMKSIKMIVDKYNGTMNLKADNNIFSLNIMLQPV